mmetsp:Transcript_44636/g.143456  ORF Transcript_44636/g.143456 Transcript_44636/m.143456 type:complete len:353 (+) Transcript_44636:798-1856(+)
MASGARGRHGASPRRRSGGRKRARTLRGSARARGRGRCPLPARKDQGVFPRLSARGARAAARQCARDLRGRRPEDAALGPLVAPLPPPAPLERAAAGVAAPAGSAQRVPAAARGCHCTRRRWSWPPRADPPTAPPCGRADPGSGPGRSCTRSGLPPPAAALRDAAAGRRPKPPASIRVHRSPRGGSAAAKQGAYGVAAACLFARPRGEEGGGKALDAARQVAGAIAGRDGGAPERRTRPRGWRGGRRRQRQRGGGGGRRGWRGGDRWRGGVLGAREHGWALHFGRGDEHDALGGDQRPRAVGAAVGSGDGGAQAAGGGEARARAQAQHGLGDESGGDALTPPDRGGAEPHKG